jgi:hypothetical protein
VEGLHAVGGILSKISINCVLIYMLCIYTCVYVYGFFLCMLHVYYYREDQIPTVGSKSMK